MDWTPQDLLLCLERGLIGSIELRNTLALMLPEFASSRNSEMDEAFLKMAEIENNDLERERLESARLLEEELQRTDMMGGDRYGVPG